MQVRVACKKNAWYLPLALFFYKTYFMINHAKSSRGPSPLWSPYLPASNLPPPLYLYFNPPWCTCLLACGWSAAGTKTNSLPPLTLADPGIEYTCLSDFRKRLKLPRLFCGLRPRYERGRKRIEGGHTGGGDHSAKKSPGQASGPPNLWLLFLTP